MKEQVTQQDIDKRFKGMKLYHFLIAGTCGFLSYGFAKSHDLIGIIACVLIIFGGFYQELYFRKTIRLIVSFLRPETTES
jgi:hypothetical protein